MSKKKWVQRFTFADGTTGDVPISPDEPELKPRLPDSEYYLIGDMLAESLAKLKLSPEQIRVRIVKEMAEINGRPTEAELNLHDQKTIVWLRAKVVVERAKQNKGQAAAAQKRTSKAEAYWQPYQAQYRQLRSTGTGIEAARLTVRETITADQSWPPDYLKKRPSDEPSENTLSKWLKD